MILSKLKFKLSISLLVLLLLTVTIGLGNAFAQTQWNCGTDCQAVQFDVGDKEVRTLSVWANSGDTLKAEFWNNGSTHGIGFGIYNQDGVFVSEEGYAAPIDGGNDYVLFNVQESGYYYLRAKCGGLSCHDGYGSIKIF